MRLVGVFLLASVAMLSGCSAFTDYMVYYQSVPSFDPDDPNELLTELTGGLSDEIEIRSFLYHRRTDEMRGTVLLHGGQARDAVKAAVRSNPRLSLAGPGHEEVHSLGEYMICLSSQPPFMPADEKEMLAELQRGLPPKVRPRILASSPDENGLSLYILVKGNFNKEAVKFALRQNPNLRMLQVEDAPPFPRLTFQTLTLLSGKKSSWKLYP